MRGSRPAAPPQSGIKWADCMEWIGAIEEGHNLGVVIEVTRELGKEGPELQTKVIAYKPTVGPRNGATHQKMMRWPCKTHKTWLGLVLYLLVSLDDEIEAGEALDGLFSASAS